MGVRAKKQENFKETLEILEYRQIFQARESLRVKNFEKNFENFRKSHKGLLTTREKSAKTLLLDARKLADVKHGGKNDMFVNLLLKREYRLCQV